MSNAKVKKPPVKNPFVCSYAPTDKAKCKNCNQGINQGSIRFGRRVHSPFHEGIDTNWYHVECGWDFAGSLSDLKDWSSLYWRDIIYVARLFGEVLDTRHPVVSHVMKCHQGASSLAQKLQEFPEAVVLENALVKGTRGGLNKKNLFKEACNDIADGLTHGLLPLCPICKSQLIGRYPIVLCDGQLEGASCTFVWTSVDILSPDMPKLKPLPLAVSYDNLARTSPFTLPSSFLNMPNMATILKEHFTEAWPSVKLFGPADKWLRKAKRAREEDGDDESSPDLEEGESLPLRGLRLYPINAKARQFLPMMITDTGATVANSPSDSHYCIISDKHEKDLSLPVVKECIGLDMPILMASFLRSALENDSRPKCQPLHLLKGFNYSPLMSQTANENIAPCDLEAYPKGKFLRMRRYASWFWSGIGPSPLNVSKVETLSAIMMKQDQAAKYKQERKRLRKMPSILPDSELVQVDYQALAEFDALGLIDAQMVLDLDNQVYHSYMTTADVATGTNKYYKLQVIRATGNGKHVFYLLKSWGRVGGGGIKDGYRLEPYRTDEKGAKAVFENMCASMTGVEFDMRRHEPSVEGRYCYVNIKGYEEDVETIPPPTSKRDIRLSPDVSSLVSKLFDDKKLHRWFQGSQLDLNKKSFQEIEPSQIRKAMSLLTRIEDVLMIATRGDASITAKCEGLASQFYSQLPHESSPVAIDSLAQVRVKAEMLENFLQAVTAQRLRPDSVDAGLEVSLYGTLKCGITYVEKESYSQLENLAIQSLALKGPTHKFTLTPQRIFRLDKPDAVRAAEEFNHVEERRLLWHGSSMPNWAGILSTGLRCAPAEAPKTGYMFGKGVYFADVATKSAQYCAPKVKGVSAGHDVGYLMLNEVILGSGLECTKADYDLQNKLADNGHVHALGNHSVIGDTTEVPSAVPECKHQCMLQHGQVRFQTGLHSDLQYDEFIVFDSKRIIPRLLVEVLIERTDEEVYVDDVNKLLAGGEISDDSE